MSWRAWDGTGSNTDLNRSGNRGLTNHRPGSEGRE